MESDNDAQEMRLLQDQGANEYTSLLHLLQNRRLIAFKSLARRAINKQPPAIDVNYLIPYPVDQRFLDKAASDNLPEFVEFLLEIGADPNLINEAYNRAPIHFAAEEGNSEVLAVLLRADNVQPNLLAAGLTALHLAVKVNCQECARLLLNIGASPNIPNSQGITALHLAANLNNRNMIQLILDISKILDLDTYKDRRKETARSVIQKKFSDITLPDQSEIPNYETLLRYHLTANDEINFLKSFENVTDINSLENRSELLQLAVERNLIDVTNELLQRGALDHSDLYDLSKIAIERAHPVILKKLLNGNSRLADRLLLTASQELGVPANPGPGNRNNRLECLKIILDHDEIDVRQEDDKGNSPLHYAARAECREAVELLLQKGSYIGHTNSFGFPPLAHIPADILESHLNECLSSSNERSEEYEIIMNYENLVPYNIECGISEGYFENVRKRSSFRLQNPCSETEALLYIASDRNLRHLLKHPLLSSFMFLKYLRIRHVLYLNFALYFAFFLILNLYIWKLTTDASNIEVAGFNKSATKFTNNDIDVINGKENGILKNWQNHPVLSSLLVISVMYLLIRESLQFVSSPLNYITSSENWLEVTLISLTFALLLGAGREVSAITILVSFWELVILIAQHPRMSTDIEMFKTVTMNFIRVLRLHVFLILAFALSFFVVFKGSENFVNPLGSLFKTVIMLTGELDSSDLQFDMYPWFSRLIFIGFIFLIVIILLNLLTGLAVNDTSEILAEAELVGLLTRARLIAYAERIVLGSPIAPSNSLCCCLNTLPIVRITGSPMRFISRRILLFPRYLPHARISIKPLKSHEITLHGRSKSSRVNRCGALTMDPLTVQRAKQILIERNQESGEQKALFELVQLRRRLDAFEIILQEIRSATKNNNENINESS